MTGRDDKLPSVLVLAQDGRTAPLRTLAVSDCMCYWSSAHIQEYADLPVVMFTTALVYTLLFRYMYISSPLAPMGLNPIIMIKM